MASPNSAPDLFSLPLEEKRSRLPVLLAVLAVAIIVCIVLVVGAIEKSKVLPEGELPLAAYASHLSLSAVQMSQASSMVGTATYIDGTLTNHGSKTITGATVQVVFYDSDHKIAQISNVPFNLIRTRTPYIDTEPASMAPIAPGQSVDFRLIVDHLSQNWDQNPPQLRLVQVDTQ